MFHTVNTVRMAGGDLKRFARDPLAAFKRAGRDTFAGVRMATSQLLQPVHDIDIRPGLENAILYGVTPKPIDAGEQTQAIGPGTSRDIQETEPNIFRSGSLSIGAAPATLIYRPTRPELLHRMFLSHDDPGARPILIGTPDSIVIPPAGSGMLPYRPFFGEINADESKNIPLGRLGVMLTPDNPLFGVGTGTDNWRITLHLSEALLRR